MDTDGFFFLPKLVQMKDVLNLDNLQKNQVFVTVTMENT